MKSYLLAILTTVILSSLLGCASSPVPPVVPSPTLVPGTGQVVGTLQVKSQGNPEPVKDTNLYLAATVKDAAGKEVYAGFDRVNSARAITDNQGHFVFQNVAPGNYGLVLDLVSTAFLLLKPDSSQAILINVVPEQQVDLGTLVYDQIPPPLNPQPYPFP